MTGSAITEAAMQQIFTEARTHNVLGGTVGDDLLKKVYDLAKYGPTSANCTPMRIVFVKTKEGKERLKPAMDPGNLEKTMAAPVTAIIGQDLAFYEHLSFLFPHAPDARSWFEGKEAAIRETAMRNSSLQGAYFLIAARAYGLDCGPMSGFNQEKVNAEFFKGTTVKSNFLCNLGYGDKSKLFPRSPRFKFEDVCRIE